MKKLLLVMLAFTLGVNAQNEVSGTVTYYLNSTQGDKPDVGAKVFLVDSISFKNVEGSKELEQWTITSSIYTFKVLAINRIEEIKENREYRKLKYKKDKLDRKDKKGKKYDEIITELKPFTDEISELIRRIDYDSEVLKGYNILNYEDLVKHNKIASNAFRELEYYLDSVESRTVDGSGRYSFKTVDDGIYYVVLISNGRDKSAPIVEKVKVKGKQVDVSLKFDKYNLKYLY
jgi:hypothetical protein